MQATKRNEAIRLCDRLTVNAAELQALLSCGRATAERIADKAGAKVRQGGRVLYNVDRLRAYLDAAAE